MESADGRGISVARARVNIAGRAIGVERLDLFFDGNSSAVATIF